MSRYCQRCGTPATNEDRYCASCGAPLRSPSPSPTHGESAAATPPGKVSSGGPEIEAQGIQRWAKGAGVARQPWPPDRPRRRRLVYGLLALILCAVAAAGGLVLLTGGDGNDTGADPRSAPPLRIDTPEVLELSKALKAGEPARLYDLVSSAMRADLSSSEFARRVESGRSRTGSVEIAKPRRPVRYSRAGAEPIGSLRMRIRYRRRAADDYRAYFVYERGKWRLWFTTPTRSGAR